MIWAGLPWPWVVALAALGGLVVVLIQRGRGAPQAHSVSSLLLWTFARTAEPGPGRLGTALRGSVILSLLVVLALSLAAGDPRWAPSGPQRRHVLVLDGSLSMTAVDPGGQRFEQAKRRLHRYIDRLPSKEPAQVMVAHNALWPVSAMTTDRSQLHRAVDRTSPTLRPLRFEAVHSSLLAELAREEGSQAVWFSDGTSLPTEDQWTETYERGSITQVLVGQPVGNLGILALGARRNAEDRDTAHVRIELFATGPAPMAATLLVRDGERPVHRQRIDLQAGEERTWELPQVVCRTGRLSATLEQVTPHDGLVSDNTAHAAVAPRGDLKVLLVSADDNVFLEAALLAGDRAVLKRTTPAAYEAEGLSGQSHDVVIFDGWSPKTPPAQPFFHLAPQTIKGAGNPWLELRGEVERPFFDKLRAGDPLLLGVSLGDTNVARAVRVEPRAEDVVVAASAAAPLLIRGERAGVRMIVLPMALTDTDLPLRTAFPILIQNCLDWLSRTRTGYLDGYSLPEMVPVEAPSLPVVTGPDGAEALVLASDLDRWRFAPQVSGFYTVQDHASPIAVNAGHLHGGGAPRQALKTPTPTAPLPFHWPHPFQGLAAAALLLMTAEWFYTTRRGKR